MTPRMHAGVMDEYNGDGGWLMSQMDSGARQTGAQISVDAVEKNTA